MSYTLDGKAISFDEAVAFIVNDTSSEIKRLKKEEGFTETEAIKMVVWGNKEGNG